MIFKKLIAGLMAVCVMVAALPSVGGKTVDNAVITARADGEYTVGTYEQLKYRNYGDHIVISGCDESAVSVVIPTEIDGVPVTFIGHCAFYDCTGLKEVIISENVTSIGTEAFFNCVRLKKITIPDSVTNIGGSAFSCCRSLNEIIIPESVTSISYSAFSYTPWLESQREDDPLVIVNGILIDGKTCSGDVVIPNSVVSICGSAFSYCSELTRIAIPDSVTSIGSSAFSGCTGLEEIIIYNPMCNIYISKDTINDTATIYGYDNSTAQEYAEEYERNFVSLGKNSAMPDDSLKFKNYGGYIEITDCDESAVSVEIPAEIYGVPVTKISWRAFADCSSLTSIKIPDSVTKIDGYAFANCSGLTSIEIPKSVKSIDSCAFIACSNLNSITILNPDCDIYDDMWTFACNADLRDDGQYHLFSVGDVESYSGTIYGYENSTAQSYAEKYNCKFESLGKAPKKDPEMGDIDGDGKIDSSDASLVLSEYSLLSTGKNGNFSEDEKMRAELNKDGTIDSSDASLILAYYSHTSTGGTDSIEDFLAKI